MLIRLITLTLHKDNVTVLRVTCCLIDEPLAAYALVAGYLQLTACRLVDCFT